MSNNGKSLTNVSFRAKMLAVIDKLKNQDKTALVRHVDDFEQLNKDTFEAAMNALVEAIPEGGGGGGGTGDGGYVVTFGINFQNNEVTCDKTIEDIIAHANNHIVGRLVVKDLSMDEAPFTINLYCDNLKFDYQQFNSDDPEIAPMLPEYTYLGFFGDAFIMSILDEGSPRTNTPVGEDGKIQYYKTCISFYYLFASEGPHWEFSISDIDGDEYIPAYKISDMTNDPFTSNDGSQLTLNVTSVTVDESSVSNSNAFWTYPYMNPVSKFSKFVSEWSKAETALFSPNTAFANGVQARIYSKPAQFNVMVDLSTNLSPSRNNVSGVFTVSKFSPYVTNENGTTAGGEILMYMDDDDVSNNKIIRHIIHVRFDPLGLDGEYLKTIYKQVEIPYTIHSY